MLNASTNKLNSDFSNLSSKVDTNTTATFNKLADTTASLDKINNSNIKLTNELLNFQNQTTQNNKSLNDMFNTQMKISEKNLNIIETQNKNILGRAPYGAPKKWAVVAFRRGCPEEA